MAIDQLIILVFFALIALAALLISGINHRRLDRIERRRPVRAGGLDDSSATRASCIIGHDKNQLTVRPILPSDLGKESWIWKENEQVIITPSYRVLVLKGIDAGKWVAVKLFTAPWPRGTVFGLLTSWDDTAEVLIRPNEPFYIHQLEVNGKVTEHFALRGWVYEPNGATILNR